MRVDKTKWEKKTFGDVCLFKNGFAFKSELFKNEGLPILRISNIGKDGDIIGNMACFSPSDYKDLSDYIIEPNDILVAMSGATTGKIAINKTDKCFYLNQRVGRIRPKSSVIKGYIYYFLKTLSASILNEAKGVAQPNISGNQIMLFPLLLPSLSEQQAIASELDAIQKIIDGYKAQLEDLDALAQSIFLNTFGNVAINDKCWDIIPMGQLGFLKNGLNYSKGERGKSLKIIGVGDFQNIKSLSSFANIPSIEIKSIPQEYLLHNEDIVFVRSNGNKNLVGRCLEVYPNDMEVAFSGFCIRFRKSVRIINKYLIALLTDTGFKKVHILKSNGIGIQNINQKLLGNLPIPVPPIKLQQQFAERVEAIEQQKEQIRLQLTDTETLMAERMQYYFS